MNQVGLAIPSIILDSPDPNPDIWNLTDTFWENTFRKWNEINLITDINFQRLDLFEDEQITLSQTIQDIRDIEKVFTDFSKSFNLPASSTNNKLFKHYYRRDLISDAIPNGIFNANSKLDALLELNFKPFRRGFIVLNGVKLKNNVPDSYNITFFGQTVQLKDRLSDRKLSSLDFAKFNHEYNVANVKEGLKTFVSSLKNQTVTVPHIIYPFISHTQRFIYNSSAQGVLTSQERSSTTRNLFTDGCGSQATSGSGATERLGDTMGFHYTDLKPAIRIIDVLETLEQDKDIDMRFTDDFFKSTGFFANLYMWLHRNKGDIGVTPSNETGVNLIVIDEISSFTGDTTDFFNDDSPSEFVPIFDGGAFRFQTANLYGGREREAMTIDFTVTPSVNTKKFTVRFRKFGTNETIAQVDHVSGNTSTQLRFTFQPPDYEAGGVVVEHNVELVIETEETVLALSYVLKFRKRIEEDGESTLRYDITAQNVKPTNIVDTLSVSDNIPDMKIINFLTGLFKTFNLTAFVEDDVSSADFAKVKVQTLDAFYASGTSRDITQYVKQDDSESNFSVPFNDIEFKFEEPKTFGAFYYDKLNSRQYGSVKASDSSNSGRDPRLNRGQDYRITVPFEKMFYERLIDGNDDSKTQIGFGYFVDDNQSPTIGKPLFFFKNTTPTGTKSIQMYDGGGTGTPETITSYNRPTNFQQGTSSVSISVDTDEPSPVTFSYLNASFVSQTITVNDGASGTISEAITNSVIATSNVNDTANITIDYTAITSSQTINFSQEIDPFIPVLDTNTLFQKFYSNYISDIFDYNRRLVKVKAILPQSFLLNYKLSDTIVINNEEFVINKITTNLQTGESSLELLNKIKRL
jgi:hypothetical protein